MMINPPTNTLRLLGARFDDLTTAEAADRVEQFIRERRPHRILARNAGIYVMEDHDAELRHLYETSDLVTVDGMAFIYLGRLLGRPFKEMTGGPALWYELLRRAARRGYRVFLLGAEEAVVKAAVGRLCRQFPGLQIVGWHHGYFRAEQESEVIEKIWRARPEILMVGMSSPRKEQFLRRNVERLRVPACVGVGGAIDLFAGMRRLAPRWMRAACLEWLYRVRQEPRRLLGRYVMSNAQFLALVLRYVLRPGGLKFKPTR